MSEMDSARVQIGTVDKRGNSWLVLEVLQNKLDVPHFEVEFWLRGHTRSLPWYDGTLEKCD